MHQVHEYTVDRAKGTAKIGDVNPARTYVNGTRDAETGDRDVQFVTAQVYHGELQFFDQGGQPMAKEDVPASIMADLLKNPVRRGQETVEQVMKFCDYCPAPDNAIASGAYEAHLLKHLVAAGIPVVRKADANTDRRPDYTIEDDEDGDDHGEPDKDPEPDVRDDPKTDGVKPLVVKRKKRK